MRFASVKFRDLVLSEPVVVQTGTPLIFAVNAMCKHGAAVVLIKDEAAEIKGTIDYETVVKAFERGTTRDIPVEDVMDTQLFQVQVDDDIDSFMQSEKNFALVFIGERLLGTTSRQELAGELYDRVTELEATIDASFDSYFVCDATGRVLRLNEAYTRITGIKAEEIVGRSMEELVRAGFYDRSATLEVIKTGKTVTFTQTTRDGKQLLVTGNPIYNRRGELVQILTNGRDITELNKLRQEVEYAMELTQHYQRELQKMQNETSGRYVVASEAMKNIMSLVVHLGKVDSTVLILGESGVGKEIIANELHNHSSRKDKPYIRINCAAIPDTLLESELFGYEPGAFTGCKREGKMGIFEIASGGTLFLDEIGDMSFPLQGKLLRVLQEGEVIRVGGTRAIPIDVRIIAATNKDLWEMVGNKTFREDLYYRLNVVPIRVPPLRERREEIPALVDHFVRQINEKYGLNKRIDPTLLGRLMVMDWPGNIRQLRNIIESAMVTSPGDVIYELTAMPGSAKAGAVFCPEDMDFKSAMERFEKELLQRYIGKFGSSRKVAAAMKVSQTTVVRKAARYGIALHVE